MICDECGLFEIPDNLDCCRACFSFKRGIPLDDLEGEEFDSFRHRMLKQQKKEADEEKKRIEAKKRESSSAYDAWCRVQEAEARGDYADGIKGCATCKQIFKPHEKYCVACARKALAAAGIPGHSAK